MNVKIVDNGNAYVIYVDGLIVAHTSTLGDAWRHIVWMHRVATQHFTVGEHKMDVEDWIYMMERAGYLD